MKTGTKYGTVKRALLYSAPFLLISAAIVLFLSWVVVTFVETNVYYRLATLAPDEQTQNQTGLTQEQQDRLAQNNTGDFFTVSPDFPAILLGQKWATISIDSADVDAVPVYHGDDSNTLLKGIGHYFNSRFPGQGGKIVLDGHVGVGGFFRKLETMSIGDTVQLDTIYGQYIYRVRDIVIFDQTDGSLLMPQDNETEELICYTCYPYRTTSVRTQRLAIVCDLVSGKDWTVRAR